MKKLINLTDKVQEKIDFIIDKEGHKTFTSAIHNLIINHYNKTYFDKRGKKFAGQNDPAIKIIELTYEQKCEKAGGKVFSENGIIKCKFPTNPDGSSHLIFPVEMIDKYI